MKSSEARKGDTVYVLVFNRLDCIYIKGTFERSVSSRVLIEEVYSGNLNLWKSKVGGSIRYAWNRISKNPQTLLKRIIKYRLSKHMIEAIFRDGDHRAFFDSFDNFEKYKKSGY